MSALTLSEAKKALESGQKIRHASYMAHEWLQLKNGMLIDNYGYRLSPDIYWRYNSGPNEKWYALPS